MNKVYCTFIASSYDLMLLIFPLNFSLSLFFHFLLLFFKSACCVVYIYIVHPYLAQYHCSKLFNSFLFSRDLSRYFLIGRLQLMESRKVVFPISHCLVCIVIVSLNHCMAFMCFAKTMNLNNIRNEQEYK